MAGKFLNARVRLLQLANNDSAVETESQCSHVIIENDLTGPHYSISHLERSNKNAVFLRSYGRSPKARC
jgi:hypothetical protein